jgi:hypothetical protein
MSPSCWSIDFLCLVQCLPLMETLSHFSCYLTVFPECAWWAVDPVGPFSNKLFLCERILCSVTPAHFNDWNALIAEFQGRDYWKAIDGIFLTLQRWASIYTNFAWGFKEMVRVTFLQVYQYKIPSSILGVAAARLSSGFVFCASNSRCHSGSLVLTMEWVNFWYVWLVQATRTPFIFRLFYLRFDILYIRRFHSVVGYVEG